MIHRKCIYRMAVVAKCPKGGRDEYQLEVESNEMIEVETLIDIVERVTKAPIFQEAMTDAIARHLEKVAGKHGYVTTRGVHSGVTAEIVEHFGG